MPKKKLFRILVFITFAFPLFSATAFSSELLSPSDSLLLNYTTAKNSQDKFTSIAAITEYYINKDNNKGIVYAQEGLELAEETKNHTQLINFHLFLARFLMDKGEFFESIAQIEKAHNTNESKPTKELTAKIYSSRALLYIYIKETDKAAEYSYKALQLYKELNDLQGKSNVLNYISSMYAYQRNYERSLEYSLKSLALKEQMGDSTGIAGALNNIASNHMNLGNSKEAIKYTRKAISLNIRNNQNNWLAINYHQLAIIFSRLEDFEQSNSYIQKSLTLYRDLNNKSYENTVKLLLAKNYYKQNQIELSEKLYEDVLNESKSLGYLNDLSQANYGLYKIYKDQRQFEKALEFYTAYQINSDELREKESENKLASLETQYLLEQKKNELELEKQKNQAKTLRKNLYMIILSISLIASLVFVVLIILRYKMKIRYAKIKQQKLQDEIEFKNKELTSNVMSLMKKNEILSEVTNKLIEVEKQAVKEETKTALNRIAKDIERSTQEKIWDEFELRFKQVHSEFYERLNKRFPDLSPNEQRLCAFLRLNLSSKEIAALTNKNTRSVEMARFRLRKKLGISAQEINLISFISSI